jgi:hypothetical protein
MVRHAEERERGVAGQGGIILATECTFSLQTDVPTLSRCLRCLR